MLRHTQSWSEAVKSLDKRRSKGLDNGFLLFYVSKVFFLHFEDGYVFGPQHMAQILFELRVQKCKKSIVVLFLSGVFGIQGQSVLVFLRQVLVIHAFLESFCSIFAFRIETVEFFIIFKDMIFLSLNFLFVLFLSPDILDKLL